MKTIALKVDVDTFRGTREGVPRLVELFRSRGVNATFLFSLGPDHTGRSLRHVFRRGFLRRAPRRLALDRYGIKSLFYGTALFGPDIGRRCAETLRGVESAGFEVGVRAWDCVRWQKRIATADMSWTQEEMVRTAERFTAIFGHPPRVHGAAGWQMNRVAYRQEARLGFAYASDTRGEQPFWPIVEGESVRCLQLPTTLPTFEELLSLTGGDAESALDRLLLATQVEPEFGHVFSLSAGLEGIKQLPALERLLDGWMEQGYRLVSLAELHAGLDPASLPYHAVGTGQVEGESDPLAIQAARYPSA